MAMHKLSVSLPQSVRRRRIAPFALHPGLPQESNSAARKLQRKDKRKAAPKSYSSAEAMKEGVKRNSS